MKTILRYGALPALSVLPACARQKAALKEAGLQNAVLESMEKDPGGRPAGLIYRGSRVLLAIDPPDILNMNVVMTIVDGRIVFP